MNYRYLGNTGVAVSNICLGTATFGQKNWGCDEATSKKILDKYISLGGNFIDTADQYADTASESIIGEWLKGQYRDDIVLATKCFFSTRENINARGLSKKHIISACEASLKRLKTDYIDLYQLHNQDPKTPLEETISALDSLVKQGKVRYVGLSNFPAWKITKANYLSKLNGWIQFSTGQYLYNLLKRDIEAEIIEACNDSGMKILCWSPLSGGMLTGKYIDKNKPITGSRFELRKDLVRDRYSRWYNNACKIVDLLNEISKENITLPSVVALTWLIKKNVVSSVIIGVKNEKQLVENCIASTIEIEDAALNKLDNISKIASPYPSNMIESTTEGWYDCII